MSSTDGWIIIGTKVDSKGLQQGLRKADAELKRYEKEAEKLTTQKISIEEDQEGLQKQIDEYDRLTAKADEYIAEIKKLDGALKEYRENAKGDVTRQIDFEPAYIELESKLDSVRAKEQEVVAQIDDMAPAVDKAITKYEKNETQLVEINDKIEKNKNKQTELNNKISEMSSKLKQTRGFEEIQNGIQEASKGISGVISKVGRWAIGVFGVYSAYSAVRSAMNTLSQYNEQLAVDIEYLQYALASVLKPVIEWIISAVYKVLSYINYIAKAWFGVNLFANASVKSFQAAESSSKKISKNLGGATKQAKELKKQLAGFDEMNILGKDTDLAGAGGGGADDIGDISTPSFDLSNLKNVKVPDWIKWIANNGKEVATILGAIGAAIVGIKLASFIKGITGATTSLGKFKAGVALVAAGIVLLAGNIINMILNWDNMTKKEKVLSASLAVLGVAFIALGYAIATGISVATLGIGALIAAVVAVIAAVVGFIVKLAKEKEAILSTKEATENLKKAKEQLKNATNDYVNAVDNEIQTHKELKKVEEESGLSGAKLYKQVQDGTLDYKNMNSAQKEVYKAYLAHKDAQETLSQTTKEYNKAIQKEKDATWDSALAVASKKGKMDEYRDAVVKAWKDGKISTEQAQKYISKAMTDLDKDSQKTFAKDLPKNIKEGLDVEKYQTKWQKFKSNWKENLAKLSANIIINPVIGNTIGSIVKLTSKKKKSAKGAIVTLPRLATGGVVNYPGKGVPIGNAITGEHGVEGVIPLTDSQQMALLGEAIGKYINIHLTNITKLDNKQIAREQKRLNNQSDFAFNR